LPDAKQIAEQRVVDRDRARRDKMFLANEVLGYDFQECHRELFAQYPDFDASKSWVEQIAGKEDILVLWPRGHYKSTAIKVCIIQAILNNPDITILLLQGTVQLTQIFLEEMVKHFRGEVAGSRLKELFPEFCGSKKKLQSTVKGFTVPCRIRKQTPQATCTIAGVKSTKASQHYMLGVFDDLQNDSNSSNPKKIANVYTIFIDLQPLVQHGGRWVSGTRWAWGDLYEQLLRWSKSQEEKGARKWHISIKTCWTDDKKAVRFPKFTRKDGEKDGFTREDLLQLLEQRPAWFACQYLNHPVLEGKQPFPEERMLAAVCASTDAPALSQPLLFIDLATGGDSEADDAVILVPKVDAAGRIFIVDGIGGQWSVPDLALHVLAMALKHRPLRVMLEKSAAGHVFVEYLKVIARDKGIALPIEFLPVNNTKDAKRIRIAALEGWLRTKRLFFFAGLTCWGKMLEQFKQFGGSSRRHDDYPDTVALIAQFYGSQRITIFGVQAQENKLWKRLGFDQFQNEQQSAFPLMPEREQDSFRENALGSNFSC
jgi:predicted phage terminase large subunit-like protein